MIVGAAFHWFDAEAALGEIHRVLRPGGGLGLVWNRPEWEGESWYPAFAELLEQARAAHGDPSNRYVAGEWRAALERSAVFGPPRKHEFRHVHMVSRREFLARVESWSVVAALPADDRRALLGELDALLRRQGIGEIGLRYRTDAYRARAHPSPG